MPKLRLVGRKAALVGVSAAAATAALVAVAEPALAEPTEQTTCTDTVRVRSQPSLSAPVIGSCYAGERVTVDETRNGFAHLVNKQGWASLEHVALRESEYRRFNRDNRDNRDRDHRRDDFGGRENNSDYNGDSDYNRDGDEGGPKKSGGGGILGGF
ncbi:MAG: SH3 domain-containing protein [Pseudonocardia sp.]|nr:SH3 domain-containing protein [Pseudonocardia sp.]